MAYWHPTRNCAVKSFPLRQARPRDLKRGRSRAGRAGAHELGRLLKRVFDIDIERCPNCGGGLKIIAAIEDPPVIDKILSHLGLPTRAPPRAPAQRFDLFQTT